MTDTRQNHRATEGIETYPIHEPQESLGDLAGRLTSEIGALFNDHLQLARVEITDDLRKAGKGAGLMGGGAAAGWVAALLLSMAAAWGLAEVVETWLAFLIVGAVWLVVAAALAMRGRKEIRQTDLRPEATMDEISRDRQWISEQRS